MPGPDPVRAGARAPAGSEWNWSFLPLVLPFFLLAAVLTLVQEIRLLSLPSYEAQATVTRIVPGKKGRGSPLLLVDGPAGRTEVTKTYSGDKARLPQVGEQVTVRCTREAQPTCRPATAGHWYGQLGSSVAMAVATIAGLVWYYRKGSGRNRKARPAGSISSHTA